MDQDQSKGRERGLRVFVFGLFFLFGGITSLNDVVIPKLKSLFTLSYGEVMLVQSAFFAAYFIVSLPAAKIVQRLGYMRTAFLGLMSMAIGCVLFIPASSTGLFSTFLISLFVLAAGITIVQIVANPLISMLGNPATVHSRLTFAQAFNSLGTTVFPYVGSILILGSLATQDPSALSGIALSRFRRAESQVIVHTYTGLALALAVLAALVWIQRRSLVEPRSESPSIRHALGLIRHRRFGFGAACIFLYVGAEVAIGSLIVSYLMQSYELGISARDAGKHVPLYWGGAMVGRFIGAYLLKVFSPGKVLACAASAAVLLLLISAGTLGAGSAYALLAIGLCNSIMFPTIFALACEGLGERAAEGSGIIGVAIVGGAVIPPLTGIAGDHVGLKLALLIPALCYVGILCYGVYARHPVVRHAKIVAMSN
ncbi:MAG TPA: sugar MFS transporter [Steroidobacteraceae bacterium]|nr:sugar MFS transporter [Steroidobacteraceae bacterium]